jgi:hypothetical protein
MAKYPRASITDPIVALEPRDSSGVPFRGSDLRVTWHASRETLGTDR